MAEDSECGESEAGRAGSIVRTVGEEGKGRISMWTPKANIEGQAQRVMRR